MTDDDKGSEVFDKYMLLFNFQHSRHGKMIPHMGNGGKICSSALATVLLKYLAREGLYSFSEYTGHGEYIL